MKVLMLGWEYPPHIAGGLGTACAGLTSALSAQGVSIHFVVPEMVGDEKTDHMEFSGAACSHTLGKNEPLTESVATRHDVQGSVSPTRIPAFLSPYWNQESFTKAVERVSAQHAVFSSQDDIEDPIARAVIDGEVFGIDIDSVLEPVKPGVAGPTAEKPSSGRYSLSIFSEVERFTSNVVSRFSTADFDLIHAHDWMTFPAAVALSQITKRPLVVHVHSLEHDRSGVFYDETINEIEKFGLSSADRVIAVSHYTKSSIERYHGIPGSKVAVVHNGVYSKQVVSDYRQLKTWPNHVVLFLGRVTYQKGPELFVEVAKRVIPHVHDVLFVLAGDGDLLPAVREKVTQLELEDHFLMPGFVQGEELEELFSVADLYVMPSVSEPFGITALEAISFDTPVIVSKQSGVAEVIEHALKVDFWDTERMADLIINALTHPELRQELVEKAKDEVARLHWGVAATKTIEVYRDVYVSEHMHTTNSGR